MNNPHMNAIQKTIRLALQRAIDAGSTQTEIAHTIGLSQGTIYKYLTGEPKPDLDTITKFAKWMRVSLDALLLGEEHLQRIAESPATYGQTHRLLELAQRLDPEELATLERCAQAFHVEDQDVRLHLIGQLKLIERIIKGTKPARVRASPPQKAAGGSGAAKDRMERAAG
jgi:transcriptional regulator with XRE-family HTH domain